MEAYFAHIGLSGWLRAFLETAFITENGLELGEQSALNFIRTIGTELANPSFRLYGESDERFKIRGGNQQITDRLTGEVADRLHVGYHLERVGRVGSRYVLTFRTGSSSVDVLADAVVCAIPFSILRTVQVDLDLPETMRAMIAEIRYGENAKTLVGFDRPFWHDTNASGVVYTDLPIQLSWDNTAMQGVQGAGLTMFSGGSTCRMLMSMNKADARVLLLDALKAVWPESTDEQVRRFERMNWSQAPYVRASYSNFGPGQWSQFYAAGRRVQDSTFVFAGEHMDDEFRGFMNGAARSGRVAAERLIRVMSS